jgi:hypothetical protein
VKGKYAAKAANRAAAVDNELAAELRGKLADATAENRELRAQLANEQSRRHGTLLAEIEQRSRAAIEESRNAAAAQLTEMQERLDEAADLVAEFIRDWRLVILEKYGENAPVFPARLFLATPDSNPASLLGIFQKLSPQRAGQLVEVGMDPGRCGKVSVGGASRRRRRRTAADIERDIRFNISTKERLSSKRAITSASEV